MSSAIAFVYRLPFPLTGGPLADATRATLASEVFYQRLSAGTLTSRSRRFLSDRHEGPTSTSQADWPCACLYTAPKTLCGLSLPFITDGKGLRKAFALSMTPDEIAAYQRVGHVSMTNTATLFLLALLYGFYLLIFPVAIHLLHKRSKKKKSTNFMLASLAFLFVTTTLYVICFIVSVILLEKGSLVDNPNLPVQTRFQLANRSILLLAVIADWPPDLNLICGDMIVVWRLSCLYPHRRLIRFLAWALLAGLTGVSLYNSILATITGVNNTAKPGGPISLNYTTFFLSLGTNAFCTAFIAYKAWEHRRLIKQFGFRQRHSKVDSVFNVLLESGAIYFVLQLVVSVMSVTDKVDGSTFDVATRCIANSVIVISAIYPTAVIILVARESSLADNPGITTMELNTSPDVRFADGSNTLSHSLRPYNGRTTQTAISLQREESNDGSNEPSPITPLDKDRIILSGKSAARSV